MKRILILEDDHNRITIFKSKLKRHDVYFFDQVNDAKQALQLMEPFDYIFLDHDLDQQIYVPSEEKNTGWQLAKFIAEELAYKPHIYIHSHNEDGVEKMKQLLPNAEIIPFYILKTML
jgi:CheY-like chemotaxis protein